MSSEPAISVQALSKCYQLYASPVDRLKQFLARGRRRYFREFWALQELNFSVMPGEVLGVIGRNGAGKSTLLQLLCGTLTPTHGDVTVNGRIAALLELGAGFNPEFTGRENVLLSAAILGLSGEEINARFDAIVEFAGLRDFIDQPTKTYSSGMYVRLAFSVATSVEPDILIIDEALSVGDGAFARKSFERIMALKETGATILFCSHSLYQVEALCERALWLDGGKMRQIGPAAEVCFAYGAFLDGLDNSLRATETSLPPQLTQVARLTKVVARCDDQNSFRLSIVSQQSHLCLSIAFYSDPRLPCPSIGVVITDSNGRNISSCSTHYDGIAIMRDDQGSGCIEIEFPKLPLLHGHFAVHVFLLCEHALHIYDSARCCDLEVKQAHHELGVVALPHHWSTS